MNGLAPELSLLLALARLDPGAAAQETLCDPEAKFDWTRLFEAACAHDVAGLLCHSLLKMPGHLLPEGVAQACADHLQQRQSVNRAAADQLTRILGELAAIGVEAIPFKGPTLAASAYGSIALRSFRDLDFLIHETQIGPCLDRLRALGHAHDWDLTPMQWRAFLRYAGQDILFGPGVPLEPHWALAPRTLALGIDHAGLWQRAHRAPFNGRTVWRLAPEDELIVLCVHGSKEKWHLLKWVVDVAEFVRRHPGLDCPSLIDRAESQGVARMLVMGLEIARCLLEAPLPAALLPWMATDAGGLAWSREIARRFFERRDDATRSIYEPCRFHWKMRERARDRWRYLFRTVTQPRVQHFSSMAIPESLFFLYTPYKLAHDYLALPLWRWFKAQRGQAGLAAAAAGGHGDAPR